VIAGAAAIEQEVMAFVVPRSDETPAPRELVSFLEQRLPFYAVPRYIQYVDDLPRTAALRVDKAKLRERGISSATWDREAAGIHLRRERL
jgi:crotonobetaine/carnitine-CoA ligase